MPALMTVDQSLVDNYLARVDRFFDNVNQLEQTLKEMTNGLKDRLAPAAAMQTETVQQAAPAMEAKQPVVTADDIDLDALLDDLDLDGEMSM